MTLLALAPARTYAEDLEAIEDEAMLTRRVGLLLAGLEEGPAAADALVQDLRQSGPRILPAAIDALTDSSNWRDERRRDVLARVIGAFPEADLAATVRATAIGDVPLADRLRVMRALEVAGGAAAPGLLLEIARDMEPARLRSPGLRGCLRSALRSALARDGASLAGVSRKWAELDPILRRIVLDAVEDLGGARAGRCLGELLVRDRGGRADLLRRLARMPVVDPAGPRVPWNKMLRALDAPDAETRSAAALAAGRLHVKETLERLMELLADPDTTVGRAALRGLRAMTGISLGSDRERWRSWQRREELWLAEACEAEIEALESDDEDRVIHVLRALARRRLHRDRLVSPIQRRRQDGSARVRQQVCATLGALGDPRAIPALLEALEDPDEGVRAAAGAALRSTTGLACRAEDGPAAWREALGL